MQCVEFETRLNDLLDRRLALAIDAGLVEHAQSCPGCAELLVAHEALLEAVAALPVVRPDVAQRQAFAHRVVAGAIAEVGSVPVEPFRHANHTSRFEAGDGRVQTAERAVELAVERPTVVAKNLATTWSMIGLALATAAAVLIAVLPFLPKDEQQPAGPPAQKLIVEKQDPGPRTSESIAILQEKGDLPLIARVGYQVADGLTPVTNSMVSALRELRKRPLFRNSDDQGRSSSYLRRAADAVVA